MQTLTGDATDGYTGCPTVGPKTAQKILADAENINEMWAAVTAAYAKQKLSAEVATVQAQVFAFTVPLTTTSKPKSVRGRHQNYKQPRPLLCYVVEPAKYIMVNDMEFWRGSIIKYASVQVRKNIRTWMPKRANVWTC